MSKLYFEGLRRVWGERSAREKFTLQAGGAVLLLLIAVDLLWEGSHSVERLKLQIEQARQDTIAVRQIQLDWQKLPSASERNKVLSQVEREAVLVSLQGLGLSAQWTAQEALRVSGRIEQTRWLKWLAEAQAGYGLKVQLLRMAKSEPGFATLDAELLVVGR